LSLISKWRKPLGSRSDRRYCTRPIGSFGEPDESSVLGYENGRNPYPLRQRWVTRCLQMASHSQQADERMRARAQELESKGIGAIDALHLGCAEAAGSQYFLTCDDRVVRRYSGSMQVLNPVNFVMSTAGGQP
jgi:hypothetical protein